jgi:hypothetical protein
MNNGGLYFSPRPHRAGLIQSQATWLVHGSGAAAGGEPGARRGEIGA